MFDPAGRISSDMPEIQLWIKKELSLKISYGRQGYESVQTIYGYIRLYLQNLQKKSARNY